MSQIPLIEELGDPQLRRDDDFYETPRWMTEALLKRLWLLPHDGCILEPCAGNGAIARVLRERGYTVVTNDLIARDFPLDFQLDMTRRASWERIASTVKLRIDAVITNLPFFLSMAVLQHAGYYAPIVATVLRRTWDEPVIDEASGIDRGEWLLNHPCAGQIVLPRHPFRGSGSDGATCAWFVWGPGGCVPPHAVVTKRERDELSAQDWSGR